MTTTAPNDEIEDGSANRAKLATMRMERTAHAHDRSVKQRIEGLANELVAAVNAHRASGNVLRHIGARLLEVAQELQEE